MLFFCITDCLCMCVCWAGMKDVDAIVELLACFFA